MSRIHCDLSTVNISVAPNPATSGTTLGVTDANASYLPDVYPYWATLVPTGAAPTRANSEIVKVTAGSSSGGTTTLTIVRAQGIPVTTAQTVTTSFDIYDANSAEVVIEDGWTPARAAWAYASADSPTFTITVPSGAASKYSVGDRIKLTQTTVKYFIITAVADTVLTVYGGTDYTLVDAAISLNYYSHQKAPLGFPLNPLKWTVVFTDTSNRQQGTPTVATWYNLGSMAITVPIGCWDIGYKVVAWATRTEGDSSMLTTLSTANNSESDSEFTIANYSYLQSGFGITHNKNKIVLLTSKTTLYLNASAGATGVDAINFQNTLTPLYIRATCTYL